MTGSSILPVSYHKGVFYFLFGRDIGDTPGFSCFGGGVKEEEKELYGAALREGAEELKGFLGNAEELDKLIQNNGGVLPYDFKLNRGHYHCHIFCMEYDEKLPIYYNNNHQFLMSAMTKPKPFWKKNRHLFEKVEINWMSFKDMKKRRNEFRPFYRDIVDQLLEKEGEISKFIKSKCKSIGMKGAGMRKTMKNNK